MKIMRDDARAARCVVCIDRGRITRLQDTILERFRRYGPIYRETITGETVVHLLDPDYIQTVYHNEGKIPHLVPLMETTQMYRRLRHMSPGLGNTYVLIQYYKRVLTEFGAAATLRSSMTTSARGAVRCLRVVNVR